MSARQVAPHLARSALRSLLRSRRWRRAHREVFVAHNGGLTYRQRLWVASLAAGDGAPALLGGRTALTELGLKGFPAGQVHVVLPCGRRELDPPPGVVVHRTATLSECDIYRAALLPCTTIARSVVDAASWARSDDEARTVVAMTFQQRMTTLADIGAVVDRLPRAKRRRLLMVTAIEAAGGAQSLGELNARRLIRKAGLPIPTSQEVRRDATGRRHFLDLYWKRWRLHVEIDGAHHFDPRQAWLDMKRQNAVWIEGERVLRFPAWVVRERPDEFIDAIRGALAAAGWSRNLGIER